MPPTSAPRPDVPRPSLNILALQRRDHARLDRLLHDLDAAPGRAEQDAVLRSLNRLVFTHAFAEESVLWPVVRRRVPEGEVLTLEVEREHQEVNEIVVALEEDPVREDRDDLLRRLAVVLREDVRDEEDELLPRLGAAVGPGALRRYGLAWLLVRLTAPTRPHPVVSRRPPGNALAALPLTVLDRTRDHLDAWAGRGRAGGVVAGRASRRLARAAGVGERRGVLQVGERQDTSRG